MADEQTQELPEVSKETTDSSDVAAKFKNTEFSRVNQTKDPIEKLADAIEAKPELTEPNSEVEEVKKESTKEELPPKKEAFNHEKWDGKIESLPENLQKIVKDNQAMATTKAQEAAKYKAELEQRTKVQEENRPLFTQEEFEEAQLNPAKFAELLNRGIQTQLEKAKMELLPVINKVQYEQTVAQNEKAINDFADEHEDFWELHDASPELFMAMIDKNKSLDKTYATLKQFKNSHEEKAKKAAQARVQEKKSASTFTRSTNQSDNVLYVEGSQDDVLKKQVEMALQGKNIQVRLKK